MTLQEFITDRKVLVCEYEQFRAKIASPDYLGWSQDQYSNRKSGRTQLSNVEIFTLGRILDEIRRPKADTL